MPYINPKTRADIDPLLNPLIKELKNNQIGAVTYCLYKIIKEWGNPNPNLFNDDYDWLNAAYGACMGAGAEYYRRVIEPFEDRKIAENGDA